MELGTFGAVMKFALQLENDSQQFYESASKHTSDAEVKSFYVILAQRSVTRVMLLERVRRENVTEMILEPIRDLESDDYQIRNLVHTTEDESGLCQASIEIEQKRKSFFEITSIKIEFLIEAATIFERLADENEENLQRLKKYLMA